MDTPMAAPAVDVASAIDSLLERKERLHKAFSDLSSKKDVLAKLGANWKDVDAYLVEVEKRLRSAVEDFTSKEAALQAKMKEATASLDKRAADVASREESSLALVQEQKDAAVAVIRELQSKLETSKKEEEDASKKEESSSEDEENATEDESPDQISNAVNTSPPSQTADADADAVAKPGSKSPPSHTLSLSSLLAKEASASVGKSADIKPRAQLKSFCEAMESDKLRNFIAEYRKDLNAISAELPFALKLADDPAQLVLNALEGYSPSDQNASDGSKRDVSLLSNKRACVIMLEALAEVLADPVLGADHPNVSEDLKLSAKEIADSWKSKINLDGDLTSNVSIDAQSFLQLLATFGLASEYDKDELCKLIIPIARRKQTPSLCRSLDLSSKVPGVIEDLVRGGKQMEAITFATEFGLLKRFPPVRLLKNYLRDCRKSVQNTGNNTAAAQNDANQKELAAVKMVLKTISDLKLEENFNTNRLEKRVIQLERAKADKKRSAASGKPQQMKRPRTNNSGAGGSGMAHDKSYYRSDNRAQYGETLLPYGAATQTVYDRHSLGGYNTTYGGASRSPVSLQSSYMYPSDGLTSFGYGAPAYTPTPSAAYGSYGYGTGLPSGYQSYH